MNMNEMMEKMMANMQEQMMEQMMNAMMNAMMGSMMGVSNAEVEEPKAEKKAMTREEFLAMDVPVETPKAKDYSELDFVCPTSTSVAYNMPVSKLIWNYTDMVVRGKFNGKCRKIKGQFVWKFDSVADTRTFLQSFQIKTEFTKLEQTKVEKYIKDKKIAQAQKTLDTYK